MIDAFASVRNHHEDAVFARVLELARWYPMLARDHELLADVACVALNRLGPRYIRHSADLGFFESPQARERREQAVAEAVNAAFQFVQAREAMGARS
jgi:nitroreductase